MYKTIKTKISVNIGRFCLAFWLFAPVAPAFAQKCLTTIAQKQAAEIHKTIKKNSSRFNNKKIAVLLIMQKDNYSDTLKTFMGIRLSEKIASYLAKEAKNNNYSILFPESTANLKVKQMAALYFRLPDNDADAVSYREQYLNNQKPDYFITASFRINFNTPQIAICDVNIHKDPMDGEEFTLPVLPDTYLKLKPEEMDEIKPLLLPIDKLNDAYYTLLAMQASSNLFSFALVHLDSQKPVNDNTLKIGNKFCIRTQSTQQLYYYVFWYDDNEKPKPNLYIFEPLKTGQPAARPAGAHIFPYNSYFAPDPPPGKVFIHIVATTAPVPVTLFKNKLPQGGVNYFLSQTDCKAFIEQLQLLKQNNIAFDTKQLLFNVIE